MKRYSKKYYCYFLLSICFIIFLFACSDNKQQVHPENNLNNFKENYWMNKEQIEHAIALGLLNISDSSCTYALSIKSFKKHRIDLKENCSNSIICLQDFVEQMYMLCGDPMITQNEQIDTTLSLKLLEENLASGKYAPQCEGISVLCKKFAAVYLPSIELKVLRINTVAHTLNMAILEENGQEKKVIFDAQNGFFYPSIYPDSLVIPEDIDTNAVYEFYWLPQNVLIKKRNFTDLILPCNFIPQFGREYYFMPENSPYAYELLGPSYHKVLWFDKALMDQEKLKKELVYRLLDVTKEDYY